MPAHLVDMPRASTPLQSPSAPTHYFTLATAPDIKSRTLVDTWQNEGMDDFRMVWTAHDRDVRAVNPNDLLQASV